MSNSQAGEPTYSVVFADPAPTRFQPVIDKLVESDISAENILNLKDLYQRVAETPFNVCLVNLLIGDCGPFELIGQLKQKSKNPNINIIVVSRQKQRVNVYNAIHAGASDFVGEPFSTEAILSKIAYHLRPKKIIAIDGIESNWNVHGTEPFIELLLESSEVLSKTPSSKSGDVMFDIMQKLARLLNSNRTSLIAAEALEQGFVIASSDEFNYRDQPLELEK